MKTIDYLIYPKWIITCEENNRILENHALAIKGDKIEAILPSHEAQSAYPHAISKHYPTHAVMPGFINSHTHIPMNVFRGMADDLPLMVWLNEHIWPAEREWVSPDLVYDGSLLAMGEMVRGGTTCFNDMYFYPDETAKAAELVGMRAHIGMTIIDFPTRWAKNPDEYFEKGLAFYHRYKDHEMIRPILAPQGAYTVRRKDLIKVKELSEKYQLRINMHVQETVSDIEGSIKLNQERPLRLLHELGLVTPNLIAIHMTQLDEKDFEILASGQPQIVHCPESNMKLVSGFCPLLRLTKLGINLALGTDGAASNNDLDMIGEMRAGAFLGKVESQNPAAFSAETMLKMATLNGAKALGIDHLTGSLTPGKSADFIAINLNQLETQPLYHPISQIVYASSREQVTDVWVAGKQLLKDRKLLTLNEDELLTKARYWQEKIMYGAAEVTSQPSN